MSIFAVADLHLSFNEDKPMYVFGDNWIGFEEKIKKDWMEKITDNDLVLLPGDFSWATYLEDTYKDFEFINNLPGKKLLLKGNHDYWWTTITRMRRFIKENNFKNIDFLYNNSYEYEGYIIAGTRGWSLLNEEEDKKFINRELIRLELSLQDGVNKYGTDKEIIVCMHYPPITNAKLINNDKLEFVDLMKKYNVKKCLYGHLHASSIKDAVEGNINDIEFKLVSIDGLDFKVYKVI
jgi:hypothetical protein